MSQSNSAFGTQDPKGTARERRRRQEPTANTDETAPEPACWRHNVSDTEWHEPPFTAAYREIHDPCSDCFPNGPPGVEDLETVVRSRSHPTAYHRPRDATPDTRHDPPETKGEESEIEVHEAISSVTDLKQGDGVLWQGQSTPMLVVEIAAKPDGSVRIRGPGGGNYQIEGRPEHRRPFYIRPGYACQRELTRVVPAGDQSRVETT